MPDAETGSSGRRGGAKPADGGGLLARLAGLFGGGEDPEREKRRLLREYAKRVQRARPRLYNPRAAVADVAMGSMFHSFYRVVGPARILLRNATASAVLRSIAIERVQSEKQREILRALSAEALTAKAQGVDSRALVEHVKGLLKGFVGGFDRKTVDRAKRAYRAVLVLVDLVSYDYWSILRRFDSRYPEADFTYAPRFLPLDADYVGDPLKDFLEVIEPVEPDMDWEQALGILREFRGMDLIGAEVWKGLLKSIGELKKSGALLATIRLIDGDPSYAPRARAVEGKLVEPYVATVRTQTEAVVRQILDTKRQQSIETCAREVFGARDLPKLSNYTAAADERLAKKSLPGFAYTTALAYAKAYLIEVHKTQVKETIDTLAIRGKWREAPLSRSLSDAYQETLAVLTDLLEFDRRLGDNQELGVKLKTAISRADRSKPPTILQAKQAVEQVDAAAKSYVARVSQGCLAMGQIFGALVEDSAKASPEILGSWQDLGATAKGEDVRAAVADVSRRLHALLQLLKLSSARPPSATPSPVAAEAQGETEIPPAP